ncbi:class I SAM-dependent methyltransferase [Jannaschia sp. W003]|uniref:class I SAM-dependent methyltransferase n=1 Tax=Jannaschia sp. W003 TaxID=2867012 RepID=UPI0021A41D7D|nr:methyltransferase [Jannaschia sp. W003]UWQ22705.1 methyltransferase [Jannaschia sp. W003]
MTSRLRDALERGAVALPDEGRILLLRPTAALDEGALPAGRCVAVTGFRPDFDALAARGLETARDVEGPFAAAVVFVPRAKALARDLVARACAAVPEGAPVVVDGAKEDGVDSLLRAVRGFADVGEAHAKAHGKVFAFPARPAPADWIAAPTEADGFRTAAGVFSADGVDPGSAMLADALPPLSGRVCDLGAGWGYLASRVLGDSDKVEALDLVEAEADALDCARRNVTDARAAFHWADATRWEGRYDAVVTNPPFHASRRADPALGRAFVAAAARLLAPRGRAWFVANRHLPYEGALAEAFGEVVTRGEARGYKVIEASRPLGGGKRPGRTRR